MSNRNVCYQTENIFLAYLRAKVVFRRLANGIHRFAYDRISHDCHRHLVLFNDRLATTGETVL